MVKVNISEMATASAKLHRKIAIDLNICQRIIPLTYVFQVKNVEIFITSLTARANANMRSYFKFLSF